MVICPGCGEENPPKFRLCGYCGVALAAAAAPPPALPVREMRKTVTIVFSDLKDSTALGERIDTEALHEVKERYFATMAAEIARHGGKVEKFIGDAIMAVFGLPRAHEDDALRAVRAALGMRSALEKLNAGLRQRYGVALANRTGINTGEVVANDDPTADQKLATGDAVNVAARLEQAAPVGEIYLGHTTWRLVRDAVQIEAVEPLTLKGKTERVDAYRLVSAQGQDGNVRRVDTPLAGRDDELELLAATWREVCAQRAVRLVCVIGDAGVGKSRLVHEAIERIGAQGLVLRGRCLPYGDGITFWPLIDMVGQAARIDKDDTPEQAQGRILELTTDADVTERVASAIGLSSASFPMHELYWGARRFLEVLAHRQPVVALIDDIHWAEPAFLELLEHVLDSASDAPVLLLATARHELLEEHPNWPDRPTAVSLQLRPLSAAAAAQVVTHLLGDAALPPRVIQRIVAAAEGNPLYVEQMLSMLVDSRKLQRDGDRWIVAADADEIAVPPTINALVQARLDRLGREERATVEPAAVIGLEFDLPAVESLAPAVVRPKVAQYLDTLNRKQFIDAAAKVDAADADAVYRFHHHVVRDTVYKGMLKRSRATLHIEFVRWLDRANADNDRGLAYEEILGYHLEQAHRYLSELGPLDEEGIAVGRDGARRLSAAAKRAYARGDMHASANFYPRAIALLGTDDPKRLGLLPEFAEVLIDLGDFGKARSTLAEAEAEAARTANQRIAASTQLLQMRVRLFSAEPGGLFSDGPGYWSDKTLRAAENAVPLFEAEQAHPELARAWRLIGTVHGIAARYQQSTDAVTRAMTHARLAGEDRLIARCAVGLSSSTLLGPTPVPQAIALCEQVIADLTDRQAESKILVALAQLRAMNGEFDEARALVRRGRELLHELGQGLAAASTGIGVLAVELLAGDLVAAEREVLPDYEFLVRAGETYFMSTMAALLSRVVRDQGRDEEALEFSKVAEGATAADDIESQALWRSIRAPIIARLGDLTAAETLARSAVELAGQCDAPQMQADTLCELATVLLLAGRADEARRTMGAAIAIYQAKGDIMSAARASAWAAGLT